jgi:hypothetical protein
MFGALAQIAQTFAIGKIAIWRPFSQLARLGMPATRNDCVCKQARLGEGQDEGVDLHYQVLTSHPDRKRSDLTACDGVRHSDRFSLLTRGVT